MKKIALTIMLMISLISFVYAQTVPQDMDTTTISKIDQEHKNTRKFLSDELTRQRNEFFNQMDDRMNYYEETADNFIQNAVWKLGLVWGAVTLFVFGISNMLRTKLEQKRFQKLKSGIISEVKSSLIREGYATKSVSETKQDMPKSNDSLNMPISDNHIRNISQPVKKSFWQRRKEKKMMSELSRMKIKEAQLMQKMGMTTPMPKNSDISGQNTDYSYGFEVNY